MIRLTLRTFLPAVAGALLAATAAHAVPVVVDYSVAGTGQTARAGFEFVNGSTLQITLAETTAAGTSGLTGGSAILTNLGFLLPRVQIVGGSVTVAPGSAGAGFASNPGAGADVSNLWGYTPTTLSAALQANSVELANAAAEQLAIAADQDAIGEAKRARAKAQRDAAAQLLANNPDAQMRQDAADLIKAAEQDEADAAVAEAAEKAANAQAAALQAQSNDFAARATAAPTLQLVGALWNPLTAFLASPPGTAFDGLDGGLLADALARGSEQIITNSVLLSLTLSDALLAIEQEQFLASLRTGSFVGYGTGAFLDGRPDGLPPVSVPEPQTLSLVAAMLLVIAASKRRRSADRR
ncbi:MAG TPA: hypothetical protein VH814_17610 [Steroidobacteraceae bacterium]|jgi:hypothetical protein